MRLIIVCSSCYRTQEVLSCSLGVLSLVLSDKEIFAFCFLCAIGLESVRNPEFSMVCGCATPWKAADGKNRPNDLGSVTSVVCGFESRRPHHVGASVVSLAPTFLAKVSVTHSCSSFSPQISDAAGTYARFPSTQAATGYTRSCLSVSKKSFRPLEQVFRTS